MEEKNQQTYFLEILKALGFKFSLEQIESTIDLHKEINIATSKQEMNNS